MVGRLLELGLAYHKSFSEEAARDMIEQGPCQKAYLAFWLWLRTFKGQDFEKALNLLDHVDLDKMAGSANSVDKQMLHNLILWISIFDLTTMSPPRIVNLLNSGINEFQPIFDLEKKILWMLRLWKAGDKAGVNSAAGQIKDHRLYGSPHYLLSEMGARLVETAENPQGLFFDAAKNIRSLLSPSEDKNDFLTLNLETCCIYPPQGHAMIISEEICKVMQALYFKKSMCFAEILNTAFNFTFYDSFIHRQKVFNFISKLKRILPAELKLKTKGERLFITGLWNHVHFENKEDLPALLKVSPQWLRIKNAGYSVQVHRTETVNLEKFTSMQFQNLTGRTRSSAHRYLKKLLDEKKVTKVGAGKKTYYVSQSRELLTAAKDET